MRTLRRIGRALGLAAAILIGGTSAANAQDEANAERGKARFEHSCAPCHGRGLGNDGRDMLPGTAALQIKYRGTGVPAVLEDRSDLTAEVLKTFVRRGSMSMPPFRPTEVTDADIVDIAAYLAKSSEAVEAAAR